MGLSVGFAGSRSVVVGFDPIDLGAKLCALLGWHLVDDEHHVSARREAEQAARNL
jgi:hypothetical protein